MHKYDLHTRKETNWVKQLPRYARILNTRPKAVLNWYSPYEIVFGRKWGSRFPVKEKEKNTFSHVKAVHAAVRCSNKVHNEKYAEKQVKQRKTQIFNIDDKVLYRYKNRRGHVPISHKVLMAKVIARNNDASAYKIKYKNPNTQQHEVALGLYLQLD